MLCFCYNHKGIFSTACWYVCSHSDDGKHCPYRLLHVHKMFTIKPVQFGHDIPQSIEPGCAFW